MLLLRTKAVLSGAGFLLVKPMNGISNHTQLKTQLWCALKVLFVWGVLLIL